MAEELDAPSLLTQLIGVAEGMLYRNAPPLALLELAAPIARRALGSAPGMLLTALQHCTPLAGGNRGAWRIVAFALLELVRADLARALEDRRTAMLRSDPDAQPNYRGGA